MNLKLAHWSVIEHKVQSYCCEHCVVILPVTGNYYEVKVSNICLFFLFVLMFSRRESFLLSMWISLRTPTCWLSLVFCWTQMMSEDWQLNKLYNKRTSASAFDAPLTSELAYIYTGRGRRDCLFFLVLSYLGIVPFGRHWGADIIAPFKRKNVPVVLPWSLGYFHTNNVTGCLLSG